MKRIPLHWQILIAIALAVACGLVFGKDAHIGSLALLDAYTFVGTLFLNALKMLIVPLVVASIVTGVAGIGSVQGFGRLSMKTLTYYVATTLLAVLLGLLLMNIVRPGVGTTTLVATDEAKARLNQVQGRGVSDIAGVFLQMIPTNVVKSAVEGDMLGLITFSLLFGYFATRLASNMQTTVVNFFRGVYDVMLLITELVMRFAPIGIFALVAKVVATTGVNSFRQVAVFFVTVLAGLIIQNFVILPLLVRTLGRVSPLRHLRAMAPAMLTAFSTASSSATLPLTMDCTEKRAGVSKRISSFVLPLGATVNMNGTALYECAAALFVAQCYGIQLGFAAQFTIVLLALLTSIGVAGIPSASLGAIIIILNAVGLPPEGIALILPVDRILDMCRTTVNIYGDACGAVIIARSEGETGILTDLSARAK
ncbi:MAG TPA: dicarboxylate/amino acid:cation symporter [Candidatus Acidoferrum sp.]|nr:dicarboxylate/amino acid:cation symporter [Candidatus Acidoferrum sp.]